MKRRLARRIQAARSGCVRPTRARIPLQTMTNMLADQDAPKKKPKYGGDEFANYARQIVEDPIYAGMPDLYGNKGTIQWEAPSNRSTGKFKDTHHLRRDWWRQKAASLGINPATEKSWISKVAKTIHPLGKKPCKSCGRWMSLSYCYPSKILLARLQRLDYIPSDFEITPLSDMRDVMPLLAAATHDPPLTDPPGRFRTRSTLRALRGSPSRPCAVIRPRRR